MILRFQDWLRSISSLMLLLLAMLLSAACERASDVDPGRDAGLVEMPLLLVAGQSCAVGFGCDAAWLEPADADAQIRFWWRCGDPGPDVHDSTSGGRWKTLGGQPKGDPKPGSDADRQFGNFRFDAGGFGPEIGAARVLHRELGSLAVVKVAFSATGISSDWAPGGDGGEGRGACYASLLDEVELAMVEARADGVALIPSALVWVQGESDTTRELAEFYGRNLGGLLAALREDLGAPSMAVGLSVNRKFEYPGENFVTLVAETQRALAEETEGVIYVDSMDVPLAECGHFDSAGTLRLGRQLGEELLREMDVARWGALEVVDGGSGG